MVHWDVGHLDQLRWKICSILWQQYNFGYIWRLYNRILDWKMNIKETLYFLHKLTLNSQYHSWVILSIRLLYPVCVRILYNHQNRLKELSILCKIHKGQLEIGDNPFFLNQSLEDQTTLCLLAWVHKNDLFNFSTHYIPFTLNNITKWRSMKTSISR